MPVLGLYHAAQVGLATKPSYPAFLSALLGVLERMKEAIGPHDSVDVDSASIAFVENFALRVFTAADEEDRRGEATRRVIVPPAFWVCKPDLNFCWQIHRKEVSRCSQLPRGAPYFPRRIRIGEVCFHFTQ
jgi:hypothetical protein